MNETFSDDEIWDLYREVNYKATKGTLKGKSLEEQIKILTDSPEFNFKNFVLNSFNADMVFKPSYFNQRNDNGKKT